MELSGKVIALLPEQTGNGRNGTWRKRDFVIETSGKYPKKVCVSVWGDKIDQFRISEGQQLTVSIEIESREYNGKWYTDVKAWKAVKAGESAPAEQPPMSVYTKEEIESASSNDDMPF